METHDRILVSLDPVSGQDVLTKITPRSYTEKPVRNLLVYLLDPSSDDLNPGYNPSEKEVVNMINKWIEEGKREEAKPFSERKKKFALTAKPTNGGEHIELDLDSRVSAYENRIMQSRSVPGEDTATVLPYIELYASLNRISGISRIGYLIRYTFSRQQKNGR